MNSKINEELSGIRVIRNLGKRSDIGRDLYPHLFRHTVATDMLRHINMNATMVYAKACDEDVKRSHRKSVA